MKKTACEKATGYTMSESNNLELSTKYQVDLNLADKNDARIIALGLIQTGLKV